MPTVDNRRDAAKRYYRLAQTISTPADYALLQSLGEEADKAADEMEAASLHATVVRSGLIDRSPELEPEPDFDYERRRPGRQGDVSPELIPVLRGTLPYADIHEEDDQDQLAPSRGVVFWTLAAAVAWSVAGLLLVALW
jgi:hypothetical protein